jgi:hypothetical protein
VVLASAQLLETFHFALQALYDLILGFIINDSWLVFALALAHCVLRCVLLRARALVAAGGEDEAAGQD